jgi:hypothetical protein
LAAAPAAADEGSGAAAPEGLPTDASLDEPVTDSVTTVDTEGTPPPEAHEVDLPIDISGSVSFRSGLGQLAGRNEYATSESISSNYSLSVGYTVIEGLSVSADASVTKFLTAGNPGCFGPQRQYDFCWNSPSVGVSYSGLEIPGADISVGFGGSYSVPLSKEDRFNNKFGEFGLSSDLGWSWQNLSVSYSLNYSKSWYENESPVVDPDDIEGDNFAPSEASLQQSQLAYFMSSRTLQQQTSQLAYLTNGIYGSFSLGHSLSVRYKWGKTGLSSSVGFGFSDAWTYDSDVLSSGDGFDSPYSDPGRGHSQSMDGSIGTSYRFLDHYSVALNYRVAGSPLTRDNKSVRFPWVDTQSQNLRYASLGLSLSASY